MEHCILSLLPGGDDVEILIVDDGSKDDTAAIVSEAAEKDPRIRLIRQKNRGKAAALRNGLLQTTHDIVVMLDADTCFQPDTLAGLILDLLDHIPTVGEACDWNMFSMRIVEMDGNRIDKVMVTCREG